MSEEPNDAEVSAAFDRLRNDAQGVDSMAALRGLDDAPRRRGRLVLLGAIAVAVLAFVGVFVWPDSGSETELRAGQETAPADGDLPSPDDTTEPTPLSMSGLEGSAWVLVEGENPEGPVPLVDGWPITLVFSDGGLGGVAACNGYGANASVTGTAIAIEGLGWNDVGCEEAVLASEAAFFSAIDNVETINLDADELTLFGEASRLVFRPDAPVPVDELVGPLWALGRLTQGDTLTAPIGQPATLQLNADGTFEGSTGCRTLAGTYVLFGASVNFTNFGAEGDCLGAGLAEQDGRIIGVLGDGFTATIDGETLTLTSEGNEGLLYFSIDEAPNPPVFEALTIADLAGTQWTLGEGIGPQGEIVSATPITLSIEPDALTGQGPCNRYGFDLDPDPERFLGDGFITNAGCADPSDKAAESAYFAALNEVTDFSVSGEFLALFGPDVELNFENTSSTTPTTGAGEARLILRADGLEVEGGPAPGVYEFNTDAEALLEALVASYGAPIANEVLTCNRISELRYENVGLVLSIRTDVIDRDTIVGWYLLDGSELGTGTTAAGETCIS